MTKYWEIVNLETGHSWVVGYNPTIKPAANVTSHLLENPGKYSVFPLVRGEQLLHVHVHGKPE